MILQNFIHSIDFEGTITFITLIHKLKYELGKTEKYSVFVL